MPNATIERPLPRCFYERDPRQVAPDLLGAFLVHGECVGRIVETEAYLAHGDPAAHAFRGRTPRTEVLFGPPGHAYVYRTRQHHCLNVAVQEVGVPGCVLIRAVEAVAGEALMRRRRGPTAARLAAGPGNLCKALGIDMRHYGADLCDERAALRIVPGGPSARTVARSRRVGVTKAKDWLLRYTLTARPARLAQPSAQRSMIRRNR